MEKLVSYFSNGIAKKSARTIGMEIETSFLDGLRPASIRQSQGIFHQLTKKGWKIRENKGRLITVISDFSGNRILYELGRQNIEVATIPTTTEKIISVGRDILEQVYGAANLSGLTPYFSPVLETGEDLLVVPDERDAIWIELDGREALNSLARISAVQFTLEVEFSQAINCLNRLGESLDDFLSDYPQDEIWKGYIEKSRAGYLASRYGGPLQFLDIKEYCRQLANHDVVSDGRLVSFSDIFDLDISLFLRSIWWYFRLKRYGNRLCIEVRPIPRREDEKFECQLSNVLDIVNI